MGRLWYFAQAVLGILFRHPVLGTSVIPVLADGRIVLVRRRDCGKWGLPGGMVQWGEDVHTTAKRELAEETGLELIKVLRLVGVYSSPERDPRIHSICIALEAEVRGDLHINDRYELSDIKAFELSAIPFGNLAHDHEQQLKDYLQNLTVLA
ncbi:NUDIX hydrolase [Tumidithrix elongata RA019]|uniref:NUDIX hydrolase n=1 Tax=Tumidithrix elongata BACA0141 TaxID=2716417 RepID=A0AAW9Q259_9CYAN|nr:NUDIX hydrolase [Tumidithrix elongata RA019]